VRESHAVSQADELEDRDAISTRPTCLSAYARHSSGVPVTAREHRHRQVENLRMPRTALAHAFLKALFVWAARHSADDDTTISIPTGTVTTTELSKVVIALINLESGNGRGRHQTSPKE
jgi:hypothetical protein